MRCEIKKQRSPVGSAGLNRSWELPQIGLLPARTIRDENNACSARVKSYLNVGVGKPLVRDDFGKQRYFRGAIFEQTCIGMIRLCTCGSLS